MAPWPRSEEHVESLEPGDLDGAQRRAGLHPTTGPRAQGGTRGGEATWEATWELAMPSKNEIFVQFANLNMAMEIVGLPIEHGDFSWFLSKNGN